MDYLEKTLKKTGWSSIISSVIFAILGIVLIAKPDETLKVISYIIGIMFILVGTYKIINYFIVKGKYDFYNYDMIYGLVAILIGIITMVCASQILSFCRILIGIWIIYSSIVRLSLSIKLKAISSAAWIYSLLISIIMFACGLYIAITSNVIVVTIGIIILVYSILDIIEGIVFMKNLKLFVK